jgi:anaerobic glycerol-3-phosphate dehydrogenase
MENASSQIQFGSTVPSGKSIPTIHSDPNALYAEAKHRYQHYQREEESLNVELRKIRQLKRAVQATLDALQVAEKEEYVPTSDEPEY